MVPRLDVRNIDENLRGRVDGMRHVFNGWNLHTRRDGAEMDVVRVWDARGSDEARRKASCMRCVDLDDGRVVGSAAGLRGDVVAVKSVTTSVWGLNRDAHGRGGTDFQPGLVVVVVVSALGI